MAENESGESTISKQLENAIKLGNYLAVQDVLESVKTAEDVRKIEEQFTDGDPVILAIDCREEQIAWFLVEKGFSYSNIYQYPDRKCDEWCHADHGPGKCPVEYDACDLARMRGLHKVTEVMEELQSGRRKPGDGLSSQQLQQFAGSLQSGSPVKKSKGMSGAAGSAEKLPGNIAKERFAELWKRHENRGCRTLIHESINECPMFVFLCAGAGVPINHQNPGGNSALHLAVRHERLDIAKALLMCGADLTLKNQLGLTPLEEAQTYEFQELLKRFQPGLPAAISKGDCAAVIRLTKLWCSPNSNIKDGRSALEMCKCTMENPGVSKCYNQLNLQRKTLELVHAVLCEDVDTIKKILRTEQGWNINIRYRDKKGATPISCAIEQRNIEIIQLLLDTGKVNLNLRVRESSLHDHTVPLIFKGLSNECSSDIWRCLQKHCSPSQLQEKDVMGNTAILRAIQEGKDAKFVETLIRESGGHCIMERNKHGQTPKELALELHREDIVKTIDKYVIGAIGKFFLMLLPVHFYGQELLDIQDESGRSLKELIQKEGTEDDMQAVEKYSNVELYGRKLFRAAALGDMSRVTKYNKTCYRDKNGYTALTRAIVFNQIAAAKELVTQKPALKNIPDNCNRYPLHYAYAMPDDQGSPFVQLLLQKNPRDVENTPDKDGILPAEYISLRDTDMVQQMLHEASTLDAYGQVGFLSSFDESSSSNTHEP